MASRKLSPQQSTALDELAAADQAYRSAKLTVRTEVEKIVADRLAAYKAERLRRTLVAVELGVPKATAGREGLHTKDPKAVDKVLAEHINVSQAIEESTALMPIHWVERDAKIVGIKMAWPTTSTDPGYPEVLEGTVQRDMTSPNGWVVLTDKSDEVSSFGTVPGWLRWEIDTVPTYASDLRQTLTTWAETN